MGRKESLAPLEGTSFHAVQGGGVVYNAAEGNLYALNPAAGLTWLCLSDGISKAETTSAIASIFNIDRAVAAEWFHTSTQMFQGLGLLGTSEDALTAPKSSTAKSDSSKVRAKPQAMQGSDYELLDIAFRVGVPGSIRKQIDSLIGNLLVPRSNAAQPSIYIEIVPRGEQWDILTDGQFTIRCRTASVAAEIEQILVQAIVPKTPHLMTLHAAALQYAGQIFLFAGSSGVGKTTLSVALAKAGWEFGCDEIVLLGRDLSLTALPLPPCIKADTFALIERWLPNSRGVPEHDRLGRTARYLPIKSTPLRAGPINVIFPNRTNDQENKLHPLDSFEGLQRLLEQCIYVPAGLEREDVEKLLQWHSERRYLQLNFNDCSAAITLLSDFNMELSRID